MFQLGNPQKYAASASKNFHILQNMNIPYQIIMNISDLRGQLNNCQAIIDAIFGTGLVHQVSGLYAEVIELINQSSKPVISVDIPSGINGNTGAVHGNKP